MTLDNLAEFRARERSVVIPYAQARGLADVLSRVARAFPANPVWIGGGAVRDAMRGRDPKDYDVFIGGSEIDPEEFAGAFFSWDVIPPADFHKSEPFMVGQFRFEGVPVPVQVMHRPGIKSRSELLDSFDWEVSLYVFSLGGAKVRARDPWPAELCLQQTVAPLSTLRRGFRFSERFGLELPRETAVALAREVVRRAEEAETRRLLGEEVPF